MSKRSVRPRRKQRRKRRKNPLKFNKLRGCPTPPAPVGVGLVGDVCLFGHAVAHAFTEQSFDIGTWLDSAVPGYGLHLSGKLVRVVRWVWQRGRTRWRSTARRLGRNH